MRLRATSAPRRPASRRSGASPGSQLTILRPSVIFGEEDRLLNLFAGLQRVFPIVPLACANATFQPVWVEDVAQAIIHCLDDDTTVGVIHECVGPEVFSLRELVRKAGELSGHARPVLPLPATLGRLQAAVMEFLPGEPLMSRDNVDSMRVPNVASGKHPGLQALGIEPARLESIARRYLGGGIAARPVRHLSGLRAPRLKPASIR